MQTNEVYVTTQKKYDDHIRILQNKIYRDHASSDFAKNLLFCSVSGIAFTMFLSYKNPSELLNIINVNFYAFTGAMAGTHLCFKRSVEQTQARIYDLNLLLEEENGTFKTTKEQIESYTQKINQTLKENRKHLAQNIFFGFLGLYMGSIGLLQKLQGFDQFANNFCFALSSFIFTTSVPLERLGTGREQKSFKQLFQKITSKPVSVQPKEPPQHTH